MHPTEKVKPLHSGLPPKPLPPNMLAIGLPSLAEDSGAAQGAGQSVRNKVNRQVGHPNISFVPNEMIGFCYHSSATATIIYVIDT